MIYVDFKLIHLECFMLFETNIYPFVKTIHSKLHFFSTKYLHLKVFALDKVENI